MKTYALGDHENWQLRVCDESPMAQRDNEGAVYLRALKQSAETERSGLALQPEIGQPTSEDAAGQYKGTSKRGAPRYKCEGSVEISEQGCTVRTWATFTDISLHGCYIEAQATYPAGTILNMKLEANGIRAETRGNVRVNYPYLGMGIAFVGLTEENVSHLRQLLAAISRGPAVAGPGIPCTLPSTCAPGSVPAVTNPAATLQELIEFFEGRQMLMREDFWRILRKSQTP